MEKEITSRKNENIKYALKLLKESGFRKKNRKFLLEGLRLCLEAAENGVKICETFYTLDLYQKSSGKIDKILGVSTRKYVISDNIIKIISDTVTPQGIICICEHVDKSGSLNKIKEYDNVIIAENIQDPSNMGTILRTCDAMGVRKVLITSNSCDVYSPKVLRGSMGSIFRLEIEIIDDIRTSLEELKMNGFITCAAVLDKEAIPVYEIEGDKIALVIGNEGGGITSDTVRKCMKKITIPMKGLSESLNVSVASGILLWEITGRGKS